METQIKEELKNSSDICFENPDDELCSLTLIEKYDKFLLGQNIDSDHDSDGEFLPDETMLREEYAQMRRDTVHYLRSNNNHISSMAIPSKYKKSNENDISVVDDDDNNGERNGSKKQQEVKDDGANSSTIKTSKDSDIACLDKLIEQLNKIRKFERDWKTISCTEDELENICETYGQILDYIYEKSIKSFEKTNNPKDIEGQQNEDEVQVDDDDEDVDVDIKENNNEDQKISDEHSEDKRLLAEKIKLVKIARDKYYEVEQQVREHIEQLELVERYKMESVG